jgi:hypothetical protein
VHAVPRFTKDLDVWIDPSPENASRAMAALVQFGAPTQSLDETDLAKPTPPRSRSTQSGYGRCTSGRLLRAFQKIRVEGILRAAGRSLVGDQMRAR